MNIQKQNFLINVETQVKKLWDILHEKSMLKFKLSITFYPNPLIEPKRKPIKISMQGERSANGDWNTSFPRDQNPDAPQPSEILKGKLADIEGHVQEYIVNNTLEADWEKLVASIDEALKSGFSAEDLECRSVVPIYARAGYGYMAHFFAPVMATVYAKEGAAALMKNDLNHASHCVDRGLHWSSSDIFIFNPNGRYTARACTGGHGKDLLREPVKDKVAKLLVTLAPEAGWVSTTTAIEAVANKLIFSHSSIVEECALKTETLPRTIRGWIQANPERFPYRIKPKT